MPLPEHEHHQDHSGHSLWPLWALGAAGAVVAAPFVLPAIGIGTSTAATVATTSFHAHDLAHSTGLAGLIAGSIGHIPVVGESLAAGGWATILTSGTIGIAGVLLSNWLKKREHEGDFPWSKIIRYGSLATSMLISLPSLLTGVGIGLSFLANFLIDDVGIMNGFVDSLAATLGTAPMAHMGGGSVVATMLPHILGCGASIIPLSLAYFMGRKRDDAPQTAAETPAYHCHLTAPCSPMRGQPCEVTFRLMTPDGRPLTDAELAIVHTRPLHTMIVDSSLRDYHHLHPIYDPERQCFVCQFTPNLQTSYTMWNDFTVKGEEAPTHLRLALDTMRGATLPARVIPSSEVEAEGIRVRIQSESPLRAGAATSLSLDIRGADGRPVTDLEPIMGAYAHLVAFSADGQHFLHTHPMGREPQSASERGTSPLYFHVTPETPGPVQFFLQIQRDGKILTLPFGQMVAQTQGYEQRVSAPHAHHAMAMG